MWGALDIPPPVPPIGAGPPPLAHAAPAESNVVTPRIRIDFDIGGLPAVSPPGASPMRAPDGSRDYHGLGECSYPRPRRARGVYGSRVLAWRNAPCFDS